MGWFSAAKGECLGKFANKYKVVSISRRIEIPLRGRHIFADEGMNVIDSGRPKIILDVDEIPASLSVVYSGPEIAAYMYLFFDNTDPIRTPVPPRLLCL